MDTRRVKKLNSINYQTGPVVYWMTREHRVNDNWSLIYAADRTKQYKTDLYVVFCLREDFPYQSSRLIDFMLNGLREVEEDLSNLNIPFSFLIGDPVENIPKTLKNYRAGLVVSDQYPLGIYRKWQETIRKKITIPFHVVDSHNIVPVWEASDKKEYAAYTIRPKIHNKLDDFQTLYPKIQEFKKNTNLKLTDWKKVHSVFTITKKLKISSLNPGWKNALNVLENFMENKLSMYASNRNDPNKNNLSDLSVYLHFGHISSQTIVNRLERVKFSKKSKKIFLEELIVRKELSDNFCYFETNYDSYKSFSNWALNSLNTHLADNRDYIYSLEEFENARTHDDLWNACQRQLVENGKMHGYLRMYWAKKILEWTDDYRAAQEIALYLNDLYSLDGRDPNGFTGVAWSIGGVHDRPWFERPIFGLVRYMALSGMKKKFDTKSFINKYK